MADNERIAKLEERLKSVKELLWEVREDFKDTPTQNDYKDLDDRIEEVEKKQDKMIPIIISVGVISGFIAFLGGYLIKHLL